MLHLHFGAGRLGLGLAAPFFRKPESDLILLNRLNSSPNPTGDAGLAPARKLELLKHNPRRMYAIKRPTTGILIEKVRYSEFHAYTVSDVERVIEQAASQDLLGRTCVVVTASVVNAANYTSVVQGLNTLARQMKALESSNKIFLVPCENTVSADDILGSRLADPLTAEARLRVRGAQALVDRMCVGLDEYIDDEDSVPQPTLAVHAEEYGSLKLQLNSDTEELAELCAGNRVEFCKHLDIEKKIKNWLLNGTHWLIAIDAFNATGGDSEVKLNDFLNSSPERKQFAMDLMSEMRDGIEVMLLNEPEYEAFRHDIVPGDYLDGAAKVILRRFFTTDDTLGRILARLRKPTPNDYTALQQFVKRFLSRVDPALKAYERAKQRVPQAATHSKFSLDQLVGSGTFVDGKLEE